MDVEKKGVIKRALALGLGLMVMMGWSTAMASVPEAVTHQGRLTDSDGVAKTGEVNLEFRIYDASTAGEVLWEGAETVDLGDSGFYSVELGDDSNPLDASVLQGGSAYLGVSVNGSEELEPRLALNSVPYAQVAGEVAFQRGTSMFDAVASGGGVLGERVDSEGAYRGQGWRVTSSEEDADGETPVWTLQSGDIGSYLATTHTAVQVSMKVSNNALDDRIVTLACMATRDGQEEAIDSIHIAPSDFPDDSVWKKFLIHCDFAPDDENQRIAVDAFAPNITSVTVDYVRMMPLLDLPFVLSWMLVEDQVTSRELATDAVGTEHLQNDSVTMAKIASDSVGPDEIDDAINVYDAPHGCGQSGLVLSSSCDTIQCSSNGCGANNAQPCYYGCGGGCPTGFNGNQSAQSCSTDFVGYLMGSDAGD